MKDQHTKIKGYRDLSQEEIDLMNRVKEAGAALVSLQKEVAAYLKEQSVVLPVPDTDGGLAQQLADAERERLAEAEPLRWANIAKTDIQTGIMALVRAIAQPGGGV